MTFFLLCALPCRVGLQVLRPKTSMLRLLHYLNSLPVPFTSRHYQVFGESSVYLKDGVLDSPDSWDELREHHEHYSIGATREEWLEAAEGEVKKDGQDGGMIRRAHDIVALLRNVGALSLTSVGVGGAGLEYQIKKLLPNIYLTCSEYAPKNVEMLRKVFTECESFEVFDILKGDWTKARQEGGVVLMYRVDPHFTDTEWRSVFERMHAAGIECIIFVPSTCLSVRSWLFRLRRRLRWFLSRTPVAFAGYVRTKTRFESFWAGLYVGDVREFGGLTGFVLRRVS